MPCPRSRRAKAISYIFFASARTLPCLASQFLAEVSVQPLPLQSFFDLQELSAPEQEPCLLHSLMPAHFTSAAFLVDLALATAAPDMNRLATALAINAFFIDM